MARLSIAPGIWTDDPGLSSQGRWVRGNNVRFRNGRPETIDLWRPLRGVGDFPVEVGGAARAIIGARIQDPASGKSQFIVVIGTTTALYMLFPLVGPEPRTWTVENAYDALLDGDYGETYSAGDITNVTFTPAGIWSLQKTAVGIFAVPSDKPLLVVISQGSGEGTADITASADVPQCGFAFVTDENFAVYGCIHDKGGATPGGTIADSWGLTTVVWSDQDAYDVFTVDDLHLAGSYDLTDGNILVGGGPTMRGNVLWTDTAFYLMRPLYDAEFVFSIEKVDRACGLVGPKAWAQADGRLFWLSPQRTFHMYDGGSVREIPCSVQSESVDVINWDQAWTIFAVADASNSEVTWYLPRQRTELEIAAGADPREINGSVSYNYQDGTWRTGSVARTCAMSNDFGPFQLAVSVAGIVYQHGLGPSDANVEPLDWSLETSPVDLATFADVPSLEQKVILNRLAIDRVTTLPPSQEGDFEVVVRRRDWPAPSEPYSRDTVKVWHPDTRYHDLHAEGRLHDFVLRGRGTAKHRFGDLFPRVQEGSGE